jgi:hypothetical protein
VCSTKQKQVTHNNNDGMQHYRNGSMVRASQPVMRLKKLTKVVTIDSRDRDTAKFADAGDYQVFLPRVYENVTQIRLKNAIIQAPAAGWSASDLYFLVDLEGLNKSDETATSAVRSGYVDSWFAKIVNDTGFPISAVTVTGTAGTGSLMTYTTAIPHGFSPGQLVTVSGVSIAEYNVTNQLIVSVPSTTTFTVAGTGVGAGTGTATLAGTLFYNDNTYDENIAKYSPPVGRIDRLHIKIRRHPAQVATSTTCSSPANTSITAPVIFGSGSENSFTFEMEYLDNVFEDVSSFETQLDARASECNIYANGRY